MQKIPNNKDKSSLIYLSGICFITDRTYCSLTFPEMVQTVLDAGIRFVQLRGKEEPRHRIYEEAVKLRELTRSFDAVLIINDHADIALAVDAEGVHLGQDDMPLREARKIMRNKIVGISTHNLEQAIEAENGGADYIGFGPIFHTTTKDAGTPKGLDDLRIIKENISLPVIAIGGITHHNIRYVIDAGADAVAVATAICKGDIPKNARELIDLFRNNRFT